MHTQTVKIERVLELHRRITKMGKHTEFSIEIDGQKHYSLQIAGWPELKAGETITAVLLRRDLWRTLAGWVNRTTGEIVAPEFATALLMGVISLLVCSFGVFLALTKSDLPGGFLPLVGVWLGPVLSGALSFGLLFQGGTRMRAHLELRRLAANSLIQ